MTRNEARESFVKLKKDFAEGKCSYKIYIAKKKTLKRIIVKGSKNEKTKTSNIHNENRS